MALQLLLADRDPNYLELFANYVRCSEFSEKLHVKSFSSVSRLQQHLSAKPCQVLLIDPFMLAELQSNSAAEVTLILASNRTEHPLGTCLYKYQPLNVLLSQIIEHSGGHGIGTGENPVSFKGARIWAVYSASGHCGKTAVALNLAKQLSMLQKKVFYINLELWPTLYPALSGEVHRRDFEEALYYNQTNPSKLSHLLRTLRNKDIQLGFDYFSPIVNYRDLREMSAKDAKLLLERIAGTGYYDDIIVDLEASNEPRIRGVLECSDRIWWLLIDDVLHLHKAKRVLEYWTDQLADSCNFRPKISYIRNKTIGNDSPTISSFPLQDELAALPYVPEWKVLSHPQQLLGSDIFSKRISELVRGGVRNGNDRNADSRGEGAAAHGNDLYGGTPE